MTTRRSRIRPELMEALQMLKFSLRKGVALDFTAGMDRLAEIQWLEAQSAVITEVPDDLTSYIRGLMEESVFGSDSEAETDNDANV